MVRPMPMIHANETFSIIPIAISLFASATLLVGLCAKQVSRTKDPNKQQNPRKPSRKFITNVSHEGMMVNSETPSGQEPDAGVGRNNDDKNINEENGVWQRAILMGERCQPPEFPGVIHYDYCGNRVSEMPKSPRATSMRPLKSFNFSVDKNGSSAH